ncbi:hypothetical protein ACFTZK_05105 [Streptomyces decoyicus]|uniref:hypothetical protein n=1 Tax=Streptomyces decoyicus TaxID=249567 RepID=UPI00363797E7
MTDIPKWVNLLWQEHKFKLLLLQSTSGRFEEVFTQVMRCASGDSFHVARASGNQGDLKCDGWDSGSKTLYAVYAPFSSKGRSNVRGKIRSDFRGAVEKWPEMRRWRFVHNDFFGLSASVTRELEELRGESRELGVEILSDWSPQELWHTFRELREEDRLEILGTPALASEASDSAWSRESIREHHGVHPSVVRAATSALSFLCDNFQHDSILDPVSASVLARSLTSWWLGDDQLFQDCLNLLMERSESSPFEAQITSMAFLMRCVEICAHRLGIPGDVLIRSQIEGEIEVQEGMKVILEVALEQLTGEEEGIYVEESRARGNFIQGCARWMVDFMGMTWVGCEYPAILLLQDLVSSMQRIDFREGSSWSKT